MDLDKTICGIWEWIINDATESDLVNNSKFMLGDNIRDLDIDPRHKDFLGFLVSRGCAKPSNKVTKWSCQSKKDPEFASTVYSRILKTVEILPRIKHWVIINKGYNEIDPSMEATWFIDPPYQGAGVYYKHGSNNIDFNQLGDWVKSLSGQVIVCENEGARWLDFKPLVEIKGCAKRSKEVVWENNQKELK